MTRTPMVAKCCSIALVAGLLAGCGSLLSPRPDATKFYLLTPASETATAAAAAPAPSGAGGAFTLGLGPVKLPPYLDRLEVVTRAAPNRVELSKTDRWGESLPNNFASVLLRDLSADVGTQRIVGFPWYNTTHVDIAVQVDVYRFETDPQGSAQLTAKWTITDGTDKNLVLYSAESNFTQTSKPGDMTDAAAALSRTVGDLSKQIAGAVQQVRAQSGSHQP
ncbi:MAG TPA: PqiC family protein [Candidatus Acidoferrales bacterium]|nr:PqiC family protein [Candidatus Acidoferrales bacterium]